jgi:hypothetical protein
MMTWRTLTSFVVGLALTGTTQAQSCSLAEASLAGNFFDIRLTMDLSGEIRVQKDDKQVTLKHKVEASHVYHERFLDAPDGKPALKSARFYKEARAAFAVGDDHSERILRTDRRLIVAQRSKDQLLAYCPGGALTGEELELLQHFDSLAVTGLLPQQQVKVQETWKVPNAVVQALCHFDGLTAQDLECRLEQVAGDVARIAVKGTASGIDSGASVKSTIQASCEFDCKTQHLTAVTWKQTDERDQAPTSPAMNFTMTVTLARSSVGPVPELHDFALTAVPDGSTPPESMTALVYQDRQKRFEMVYARDWQLVAHTGEFVVLRYLDRGDFVAQATITPLRPAAAGKTLSDDEFKDLVNATPGWDPETEAKVEQLPATGGQGPSKDYTIKRLAAQGSLDGQHIAQYCYLIASPQGEQLIVSFALTPAHVAALDTRDIALVRGITLTASH